MKKSENTKGNPYHDDDGKFTTKDGQGSSLSELSDNIELRLKPGADLSGLLQRVSTPQNQPQQGQQAQSQTTDIQQDLSTRPTMPISIQDAEAQGAKIVGSAGIVRYSNTTDLAVAKEFNDALYDVATDFPLLIKGDRIRFYGTKNISKESDDFDYVTAISSYLSMPEVAAKMSKIGLDPKFVTNGFSDALRSIVKNQLNQRFKPSVGGMTSGTTLRMGKFYAMSAIKFNPMTSKSASNWDAYLATGLSNGNFLPTNGKTGAYSAAVHECGHHIDHFLEGIMKYDESLKLTELLNTDGNGKPRDVLSLMAKHEISAYATTSKSEHIAEAFADVYCRGDAATAHNKKIVKFMKGIYDRVHGSK